MPWRRSDELAELFAATAEGHVGYRNVTGPNEFSARVGYNGHDHPWDGAFLDCVQREAGLVGCPSLVATAAGLGELVTCRRAVLRPTRGDIVFFSFPVTTHFAGPHVGVVADGSKFLSSGKFISVEAQVASGQARASKDADGIFKRRRDVHDVLMFCRPLFRRSRPGEDSVQTGPSVELTKLTSRRKSLDTSLVQGALNTILGTPGPGRPFRADGPLSIPVTGIWDDRTRASFARFQRSIGFVGPDASGEPEPNALARLGRDSGRFSVSR